MPGANSVLPWGRLKRGFQSSRPSSSLRIRVDGEESPQSRPKGTPSGSWSPPPWQCHGRAWALPGYLQPAPWTWLLEGGAGAESWPGACVLSAGGAGPALQHGLACCGVPRGGQVSGLTPPPGFCSLDPLSGRGAGRVGQQGKASALWDWPHCCPLLSHLQGTEALLRLGWWTSACLSP